MMLPLPPPATVEIHDLPAPPPAIVAPAPPLTRSCEPIVVAGVLHEVTGYEPVPSWGLWQDPRAGAGNTYVVGHSWGAGSFILRLSPGAVLCYGGRRWRVIAVRTVNTYDMSPLAAQPVPTLTLQTCATADATWLRIVRALRL